MDSSVGRYAVILCCGLGCILVWLWKQFAKGKSASLNNWGKEHSGRSTSVVFCLLEMWAGSESKLFKFGSKRIPIQG